jgi:uncharacterized protein YneF (UPF0154 family)
MRSENLLFSAVQFLFVLALSCTGLFFISLPWAPYLRFKCASFLAERDDLFILFGGFILAIGIILGVVFYFLQRKAYFQVKINPSVHIEKELIQALLDAYWKKRFPGEKLKTDVALHDQKLELIAELPSLNSPEPQKLLSEIEREVTQLLVQQLGYKREFSFTFQVK